MGFLLLSDGQACHLNEPVKTVGCRGAFGGAGGAPYFGGVVWPLPYGRGWGGRFRGFLLLSDGQACHLNETVKTVWCRGAVQGIFAAV